MIKTYAKNNKKLSYKVNKKNNKHTYIKIRDNIVVFNASKNLNDKFVLEYLNKNFERLYKITADRISSNNNFIVLWGKNYEIKKSKYINDYKFNDDFVYINENQDLTELKKIIYLKELTKKLEEILPNIEADLKKHGITPTTYKYKFLRSKFGSYHKTKNEITLNTFLAKLDENLLTYVIYHEYAHQKVFNHSNKFYDFLKQIKPDYKEYDKALKSIAIYI